MIINKSGGTFSDTNAVAWMFERRGVVSGQRAAGSGQPMEALELALIDLGIEDIAVDGDTITVTTNQSDWTKVRDFLKEKEWDVKEAGLKYVAKERVRVTDETSFQKIAAFIEALETDDDVAEVSTNAATSEQ